MNSLALFSAPSGQVAMSSDSSSADVRQRGSALGLSPIRWMGSLFCLLTMLLSAAVVQGQPTEAEQQAERVRLRQTNQDRRVQIETAQQQDRAFRQVTVSQEAEQPPRSVAAASLPDGDAPAYLEIPRQRETTARTASRSFQAAFLGESISFRSEAIPTFSLQGRITEERIQQAFQSLHALPIPVLLNQLQDQAAQRKLNDWGFLQWVHTVTGVFYGQDPAARTLATAWLMQKSGYRATVSYSGNRLYLLVHTRQKLYGHSFLNAGNVRMYVVNPLGKAPSLSSAFLFEPAESQRGRPIDLQIKEVPHLTGKTIQRPLAFTYNGVKYKGEITVNSRVAAYFYRYPLVDWSVYVGAPLSNESMASLRSFLSGPLSRLQPRQGWTLKMEQANFLLHFIQSAFPYRTDGDVHGEEHYSFAEEMLALRYSDCEDRAALYMVLVKEFLQLDAVGLVFPGHAAAGIYFGPQAKGDAVTVDGKKYLVCDPSYIGADIGKAMPQISDRGLKIVRP